MDLSSDKIMTQIKADLIMFINSNFMIDIEAENVSHDTSLILSGVIDSTGLIELVAYLQKKYNLAIDNSEVNQANFGSINKIVSFIKTKIS